MSLEKIIIEQIVKDDGSVRDLIKQQIIKWVKSEEFKERALNVTINYMIEGCYVDDEIDIIVDKYLTAHLRKKLGLED